MARNGNFNGVSPFSPLSKIVESSDFQKYMDDILKQTLSKMQSFLVSEEIALPGRIVKSLPTVAIVGDDGTGHERLIEKELVDKFGYESLENEASFNLVMPFVSKGVIKTAFEGGGAIYTVFEVVSESEEKFDLSISEYRVRNGVFYVDFFLYVQGIPKKTPFSEDETRYASIHEFLLNKYSREELSVFTDQELELIGHIALGNDEVDSYCNSILTYTLSTFRCINYIRDKLRRSSENDQSFECNDYFTLKNWNPTPEARVNSTNGAEAVGELERITDDEPPFSILPRNTIGRLIPMLAAKKQITTFRSAVGFAYKSGLMEFAPIFDNEACSSELIIGALQNIEGQKQITKMDRMSAEYINDELLARNVSVLTHPAAFYHGKFYYLRNEKKAYIAIGSSNISKAAFHDSFELDVLYITDVGSEIDNAFCHWYSDLRNGCISVTELDPTQFYEQNWDSELVAYDAGRMRRMSDEELGRKIAGIQDKDTKYRMELWLGHKPVEAYENHGVSALKEYTMLVYPEEKLVAFECLLRGNAYYVFRYTESVGELLEKITNLSKGHMMLMPRTVLLERGYHLKDPTMYESRIKSFFRQAHRKSGV